MGTDKPLLSILMAVYEPHMDWLKEQLDSLNAQTYPNLRLYLRDDCSPTVPFDAIRALVGECITAFPFTIARNEKNLGSNGTFELLTQEAEGKYFAYCDQDDVWLPEKLTVLQETIEREGAELVCSDMFIIDGNGAHVADSITKIRRHHVFRSGAGLAPKLLISNFATGCTILVRAETARAAVPFCPYMVHDHYLALFSAARGAVISLPDRLIRYRIHEENQTSLMSGVYDRQSYFTVRVLTLKHRLEWLADRFQDSSGLSSEIGDALRWAGAREEYFRGTRSAGKTILQYRRFGLWVSLFELLLARAPEPLFLSVVELNRKNIL